MVQAWRWVLLAATALDDEYMAFGMYSTPSNSVEIQSSVDVGMEAGRGAGICFIGELDLIDLCVSFCSSFFVDTLRLHS